MYVVGLLYPAACTAATAALISLGLSGSSGCPVCVRAIGCSVLAGTDFVVTPAIVGLTAAVCSAVGPGSLAVHAASSEPATTVRSA